MLPSSLDVKKEKVKGGHELYIPPLRRGSETGEFSDDLNENRKGKNSSKHLNLRKPEIQQASGSSPASSDKPMKSILKKTKSEPEKAKSKPETPRQTVESKTVPTENEIEKKNQREQKEINNFVQSMSTLVTHII